LKVEPIVLKSALTRQNAQQNVPGNGQPSGRGRWRINPRDRLQPSLMIARMTLVAIWTMRLLGVAASAYVAILAAINLPGAWNYGGGGALPRATYTNWKSVAVLTLGVALAAIVLYWVLRGSTARATAGRVVIGVLALGVWLVVVAATPYSWWH
jgi:hypothetical protein